MCRLYGIVCVLFRTRLMKNASYFSTYKMALISLSSAEDPLCRKEAGKRVKESARTTRGRGKRAREVPAFSSSHRSPRAYFFLIFTQRKPLPRERERERERVREGEYVNGNTGLANAQEPFPFLSETSKPRWE